ncbi:MAG: CvpA family protein [Chloroflexota bacterium]
MSWNLTLDILLIVLILLFAPIGYMRGPVKELLVTLGVLFGALLVDFWARPWGRDLDSYANVGDDPGAFIVAMAFLMLLTFIGGYGLGLLISSWDFSVVGRLGGAVVSLLNGVLLVSFSLQYVRLFLLSDANEESLEQSLVVRTLLDQTGWILIAVALAIIPVLIYGLASGRRAFLPAAAARDDYFDDDEYEYEYEYEDWIVDEEEDAPQHIVHDAPTEIRQPGSSFQRSPDAEPRIMPPRLPGRPSEESSRGYKAEPEPEPESPRRATRTLRAEERSAESGGTHEPEVEMNFASTGDTDPEMTTYSPIAKIPGPVPSQPEAEKGSLAGGYFRCENCHAVLPPRTKICTVCGHVHGEGDE